MNIFRAAATAGAPTFSPLLGLDNAGNLTLPAGDVGTVVGSSTAKSRFRHIGGNGLVMMGYNFDGAVRDDTSQPGGRLYLQPAGAGNLTYVAVSAAGASTTVFQMSGNDLIIAGANATKASGTTWANPSDIRLKENVKDYARGLADILRLHPISYTLKATGTETCGFDADRVREVFPECVGTTRMKLNPDDEEETDVLTFDMHAILVALVNAVQELAAR